MQVYIRRNNDKRGPFDLPTIQKGLDAGKLLPTDFAMMEGTGHWITVSQIPGIICPNAPTNHASLTGAPLATPTAQTAPHDDSVVPKWLDDLWTRICIIIFLVVFGPKFVSYVQSEFFAPPNPYANWTLQHTLTKQPAERNLDGIEITDFRWPNGEQFLGKVTATVTNNSQHELDSVQVFILFKNSNDVSTGEGVDITGALKPKDKWEVSFYVPTGANSCVVSHTISYAPMEYARN